jgi:hypothetical protein
MFRASLIATILLVFCACNDARQETRASTVDPEALVGAYFEHNLVACEANADCLTQMCDKSPFFTVSDLGGYCLSFSNSFQRWQRVWLARQLGRAAREDTAVQSLVLSTIGQELDQVVHPSEREILVLLLSELGSKGALERLEQVYKREAGGLKQLAALRLATAGFEEYTDDVVNAALSSTVRLRMHAAYAAAGLCNKPALGALKELLDDVNVQVRQAAATAAARCGSRQMGAALKRKLDENRDDFTARPGDRFLFGAALDNAE